MPETNVAAKRPILKAVLRAGLVGVLAAVAWWVVAHAGFLGLDAATRQRSDAILQQVFSPRYGLDSPHPAGQRGQDLIRAVTLDEAALKALGDEGWRGDTPTYGQYAQMLDRLMTAGGAPPDAIFIDGAFLGLTGEPADFAAFQGAVARATRAERWNHLPGCVENTLTKLACIIRAGGTPVILAKPDVYHTAVFTELQQDLDSITVLAATAPPGEAYRLFYEMGNNETDATEQLFELSVHEFDLSPAAALYAAYCLRSKACDGAFSAADGRAAAALAGDASAAPWPQPPAAWRHELSVVWGSRPSPFEIALTKADAGHPPWCRGAMKPLEGRISRLAGLFVARDEAEDDDADAQDECPYTLAVGYDRIDSGLGLRPGDLSQLLAGKLVLVGVTLRAPAGQVVSPVHGAVPGLFRHAMALDNLIEGGVDFRHVGRHDLAHDLPVAALVLLVGMMIELFRDRRRKARRGAGSQSVLSYLGLAAAGLAAIGLATWAWTALADESLNWVEVSLVLLLVYLIRLGGPLIHDLWTSARRWVLFADLVWAIDRAKAWLDDRAPEPARTTPRDDAAGRPARSSALEETETR